MKSNVCMPLLNILHKHLGEGTIYVSELILTPFSPFDVECKKLNPLSASTAKWSNKPRQFTSSGLKGSCEEPVEMISYCIIFETNIFIEMVICVAIDFK